MTHTYTRGCFKLIFRKCLPIHTPYPRCRKHKQRHPHTNVLYRDCPPSRAFASSNDTTTPAPFPLCSVSCTRIFFPSYLSPFFAYLFSSASSSFTSSYAFLFILSRLSRLRFFLFSSPSSSVFLSLFASLYISSLFNFTSPFNFPKFHFFSCISCFFFSFSSTSISSSFLIFLPLALLFSSHILFILLSFSIITLFLFDLSITFCSHFVFSFFTFPFLSFFFSLTYLSRSTAWPSVET